jgi:hypothetical protein
MAWVQLLSNEQFRRTRCKFTAGGDSCAIRCATNTYDATAAYATAAFTAPERASRSRPTGWSAY